ncbi:hypothetical protein [Mesorhizobium sp. B1-1-8]|uniref:hypothetical protein n=1 Tax=Mesorhizobium sp. B1-1-8 TaxID=2589976 RepID=UPI0015E29ADC|nr:hypothetical protein [Mesorhizobium sp. B1-1-8]UCI08760.1 hypothetical protein FJ974_06725 [Mesorhizobium sp. B1-1-8]
MLKADFALVRGDRFLPETGRRPANLTLKRKDHIDGPQQLRPQDTKRSWNTFVMACFAP